MTATSTQSGGAARLIDPAALMRIRPLELRARVVVEGTRNGLHRSPYHGFSVEFTEYRQYTPGDDLRHLDWRVYARSDRYEIKKFEDETNLRCHLVVDQSRSMNFGSLGHSKAEYAATLAATLSYFLQLQGDAVGLMTFDETTRDYLPARNRIGHLRRLMLALERPAQGASTNLLAPLRQLLEVVRKRGVMVFISDFLAPLDQLETVLASWLAGGHEVVLFQIMDPRELNFDFGEPGRFEDLESGKTLALDPSAIRADYLRQLTLHLQGLRGLCERRGIGFRLMKTDQPLELALLGFIEERSRSGRMVHRANLESTSSPA